MRGRSGADGGTERTPAQHRGQSEVVGMVLLIGAIMIGAFLTIAIGSVALQAVQDSSASGLTQDTAQEAHAALSQAATTGDPQAIPVGEGAVDASSGDHPNNVRVLTDGDEVPDLTRGYPDQRTAAEVLNQGAADRIDTGTGELNLSSNEAVFLFEMTEPDATWSEALATDGDPDYNDVIAIVEFETPEGDVPIEMNVSDDGTGLVFGSPSVSAPGDGSIATGDITTTPGDAAAPGGDPGANGTMPAGPTPPEDVEADVVQVG